MKWNTFEHVGNPTVVYGLTPFTMFNFASSKVSVTYNTSLTYNNHVKITGLKPDTKYYYLPTTLMLKDLKTGPFSFKTSKVAGDQTPYSIAVVVDMGTMGPEGLYTSAGTGVSPNNILKPGEVNTIQSLGSSVDQFDFLWHRKFFTCDIGPSANHPQLETSPTPMPGSKKKSKDLNLTPPSKTATRSTNLFLTSTTMR
jgi:acid phosphatase type 7